MTQGPVAPLQELQKVASKSGGWSVEKLGGWEVGRANASLKVVKTFLQPALLRNLLFFLSLVFRHSPSFPSSRHFTFTQGFAYLGLSTTALVSRLSPSPSRRSDRLFEFSRLLPSRVLRVRFSGQTLSASRYSLGIDHRLVQTDEPGSLRGWDQELSTKELGKLTLPYLEPFERRGV